MEIEYKKLLGITTTGVVEKVLQYGAFLKLENSDIIGYLHISQLSEEYTRETLDNVLAVGEKLMVQIISYSNKYNSFEVSRKAVIRNELFENSGLKFGDVVDAKVISASELSARIVIEEKIIGIMEKERTDWGLYEILHSSGNISAGNKIKVIILGEYPLTTSRTGVILLVIRNSQNEQKISDDQTHAQRLSGNVSR